MYYLKLLEVDTAKTKIVAWSCPEGTKTLDKRHNLNSCINTGHQEFTKANADNPNIVGFAIYRKSQNDDNRQANLLEFHYIHLSEYAKLNKEECTNLKKQIEELSCTQ